MELKTNGIRIILTEEEAKDLMYVLSFAMAQHDELRKTTSRLTINGDQYNLAGNIVDAIQGATT